MACRTKFRPTVFGSQNSYLALFAQILRVVLCRHCSYLGKWHISATRTLIVPSSPSLIPGALGTWKASLLTCARDPAESSANLSPLTKIRIVIVVVVMLSAGGTVALLVAVLVVVVAAVEAVVVLVVEVWW